MSVGPVDVRPLFDQSNPGVIDNGSFELAEDGRALVYVTFNEDGQGTWLSRLRVLADVDACFGCSYDQGTLLAERVGLNYTLEFPRFGADGSTIWLEDRRGDYSRPYLSTVPVTPPETGLHEPQSVVDGGLLSREIHILGLRSRGDTEVLAYTSKTASGCIEVVVVDTAHCSNGACPQVNSTTPAVLTIRQGGSFAGASETELEYLLEDALVGRKGQCSRTGAIKRVVDTGLSVQSTVIATGLFPASK
jgi:hypothetical protein